MKCHLQNFLSVYSARLDETQALKQGRQCPTSKPHPSQTCRMKGCGGGERGSTWVERSRMESAGWGQETFSRDSLETCFDRQSWAGAVWTGDRFLPHGKPKDRQGQPEPLPRAGRLQHRRWKS